MSAGTNSIIYWLIVLIVIIVLAVILLKVLGYILAIGAPITQQLEGEKDLLLTSFLIIKS